MKIINTSIMMSPWIFSQLMLITIFPAGDTILCGTRVTLSERSRFSYLVEIIRYDNLNPTFCAGAIIDATHILTAAHCFCNPMDEGAVIIAGVVHLNSILRMERIVSKIHVHEKYNYLKNACRRWEQTKKWICTVFPCTEIESAKGCRIENDIAVLTLSEALPVGEYIKVVNLPDTDFLPYCQLSDYAGWGRIEENGPISTDLFSIQMMILTTQDCKLLRIKLFSNQFCAMDPLEQACPLEGDSGAPLVFNNTIYGVCSTGGGDPTYPNIFSKVFDHLDFIRKALKD